ncbi:hypothetical protein [Priestia megaterium]|uniref:hypothetical protein n=1 Tax=Priestia megaterium TaxID=1404 RepID=UPI001EE11BD5|nr:hypothetical protein [Priestia megaterium]MDH3168665.1 hypothetical protein [Priestia megaterium]
MDLVGLANPVDLVGLAAPVDLVGLAAPVDLVGLAVPVDLVGLAAPVNSVSLAAPVNSVSLAAPVNSVSLANTVNSVGLMDHIITYDNAFFVSFFYDVSPYNENIYISFFITPLFPLLSCFNLFKDYMRGNKTYLKDPVIIKTIG